LTTYGDNGDHSVAGSIFADGELRIISIDQYPVNVSPSRYMLVTRHRDMPGIIGKLGSLLGSNNVNIASMKLDAKLLEGKLLWF
jgi:D-3-phosphoglycerate dehydrogenase